MNKELSPEETLKLYEAEYKEKTGAKRKSKSFWIFVLKEKYISEKFADKYINYLGIDNLSYDRKYLFTEEFMLRHLSSIRVASRYSFSCISSELTFSEDFLDQNINCFNKEAIAEFQDISYDFATKHDLDFKIIATKNQKIDDESRDLFEKTYKLKSMFAN